MRINKPITRVVDIDGSAWNVTLGFAGISFRAYRSRKTSEMLLPFPTALSRAAWLNGDKPKRKRKVKRGASLRKGS